MLTSQEIDRLVERIAARLRPERIVVFGSYAKGTATRRSDLDLLVIMATPLPYARRTDAIAGIVAGSLIPVDVHVYTPEEVDTYGREAHSFLATALRTGTSVYWPDRAGVADAAGRADGGRNRE